MSDERFYVKLPVPEELSDEELLNTIVEYASLRSQLPMKLILDHLAKLMEEAISRIRNAQR